MHRALAVMAPMLLACLATAPSFGADPAGAGAAKDGAAMELVGDSGRPAALTAEALAQLPAMQLTASFEPGLRRVFEGPLLWTVLDHSHLVDPSTPRAQAR